MLPLFHAKPCFAASEGRDSLLDGAIPKPALFSTNPAIYRGDASSRAFSSTVLTVYPWIAFASQPPTPSQPIDKSKLQQFLDLDAKASNPFKYSKIQQDKKKKEEEAARKKLEAEKAARRKACEQFLREEWIAADPQSVIKKQQTVLQSLAEQLQDAEKNSKSAASQIEELKKKLGELNKQLEDQTKALADKDKTLKDSDAELKKRLEDLENSLRGSARRQQGEINRLKEKSLGDFETATFDGIEMVKIPAGSFTMGASESEIEDLKKRGLWSKLNESETPAHKVTISKPFFIAKFELTQKKWLEVMGPKNPAGFKGDNLPMESISFNDAIEFLRKLGEKTGGKYRLPTEAEWEYCCRAGGANEDAKSIFGTGANGEAITFENLDKYAWMISNSENKTHDVGGKLPNAWGLHDTNGSVWEWCADGFDPKRYTPNPETDPGGGKDSTELVFRGGCWALDPQNLRAAARGANLPAYKSQYVGFRVVREIPW